MDSRGRGRAMGGGSEAERSSDGLCPHPTLVSFAAFGYLINSLTTASYRLSHRLLCFATLSLVCYT